MLTCAASTGCASIPHGAAAVDGVHVEGNHALDDDDIEERLAITPSQRFLSIAPRGFIYDYSLFDQHVLERDLARIERLYQSKGYYDAHARAGRVFYTSDKHVEVTLVVDEGKPTKIGRLDVLGLEGLSPDEAKAARQAIGKKIKVGNVVEEEELKNAEEALNKSLTDHAYAFAKVSRSADVDLPNHFAAVALRVVTGPKCVYGPLTITGLEKLPETPVRLAMDLKEGKPYSTAEIDSAKQAVLDLGTFSSIDVDPVLPDVPPADHVVPLKVTLHVSKLHSVLLGGGVEFDPIKSEVHLHAGWEHKNLFGGFRHFQVDFKPGAVLYPTRLPTLSAPTAVLPEEMFKVELRQPGFIEARTTAFVRGEANFYPILLTPQTPDSGSPVLGWEEFKGATGLERTFHKLTLTTAYDLQYDNPFAYIGTRDPDLTAIIASYVEVTAQLDYRNDKTKPHKGVYAQASVQAAGLGGSARDIRIQPEFRGYIPIGKRITIASRATVGELFAQNYGSTLTRYAGEAPPDSLRADWVKDIELFYLRGFFSGGPSSNRGYPLRGVGPHGIVPFFNPGVASSQVAAGCGDVTQGDSHTDARCAVPLGGKSLWELSLEMRIQVSGPFGVATFCDASDVELDVMSFKFWPHLSCGLGARYDTPIGPVRLDVGYRIPGMQTPGTAYDIKTQGDPGNVFGAPIAFSFGIGEAF